MILDASTSPAGSWPRYYYSLTLFSPARFSQLPGLGFPGDPDRYPHRDEVVNYLTRYASRLDADIRYQRRVTSLTQTAQRTRGAGRRVRSASAPRHCCVRKLRRSVHPSDPRHRLFRRARSPRGAVQQPRRVRGGSSLDIRCRQLRSTDRCRTRDSGSGGHVLRSPDPMATTVHPGQRPTLVACPHRLRPSRSSRLTGSGDDAGTG